MKRFDLCLACGRVRVIKRVWPYELLCKVFGWDVSTDAYRVKVYEVFGDPREKPDRTRNTGLDIRNFFLRDEVEPYSGL